MTVRTASSAPSTVPARAARAPGARGDEQAVTPEDGVDGVGVGIQVEQRPAALHGGREVAEVGEAEPALDATVARGELGDAVAVREAQRAPVGVAGHLLDPGHSASRQEAQQGGAVERCAVRQPQEQRARFRGGGGRGGAGLPAPPRPPPHLGRRQGEHRPHGVVELTQAGEAGREGDVVERYGGRFDQQSRRLGALGSRKVEGSRAELLREQPAQVARAVGESPREAVDAFAVDDAIGDEAHGASRKRRRAGSTCGEPGTASGRQRRQALKPARLGRGGRGVEAHVLAVAGSPPGSSAGSRCRCS